MHVFFNIPPHFLTLNIIHVPTIVDLIVLEYSPSQQAFHRLTVFEMLTINLQACFNGLPTDYKPVGFFTNADDCDRVYKTLADKFRDGPDLGELTVDDLIS